MMILMHCSCTFFVYVYPFFILRSLSARSTVTNLHIFLFIYYSLLLVAGGRLSYFSRRKGKGKVHPRKGHESPKGE